MSTNLLQRHFNKMGAQLKVDTYPLRRDWLSGFVEDPGYTVDIQVDERSEVYVLSLLEDLQDRFNFQAVDVRPKQRHLLLMVQDRATKAKDKFLWHRVVMNAENQLPNMVFLD